MRSSSAVPAVGAGGRFAAVLAAVLVSAAALLQAGCASGGAVVRPPMDDVAADESKLPSCNCYFATDCKKWFGEKTICDRNEGNGGSGGKETKCRFMKPKPDKEKDEKGCTTSTNGAPSTCDGHCIKPSDGSFCGGADRSQVARAVEFWTEAFIRPARSGGGPVEAGLVAESRELDLPGDCNGEVARIALSLVELAWSDILVHPEGMHVEEDHEVPDLSDDPCRLQAATVASRALVNALDEPGSRIAIAEEIREACPEELPFPDPCRGADAVRCVEELLQDMATYLSTPPAAPEVPVAALLSQESAGRDSSVAADDEILVRRLGRGPG